MSQKGMKITFKTENSKKKSLTQLESDLDFPVLIYSD